MVPTERALGVIDRDELGLGPDDPLPPALILLARPAPDDLAGQSAGEVLTQFWRHLFRARVQLDLESHIAAGTLTASRISACIERIGEPAFAEVGMMLRAEDQVRSAEDPIEVFLTFTAVYLTLRTFQPLLVPDVFPSLASEEARIDAILSEVVDGPALLVATRPSGAFEPAASAAIEDESAEAVPGPAEDVESETPPAVLQGDAPARYARLMVWGQRGGTRQPGAHGGLPVRGGHFASRPVPAPGAARGGPAYRTARHATGRAPGAHPARSPRLAARLARLARAGRAGLWPPEARLLYDLQKIANEHDREVFAVDLATWAVSLGRRPLRRPLPFHRDVLRVNHLRTAQKRLPRIRVPESVRAALTQWLHEAVDRSRQQLRDRFRPRLEDTLAACGWDPRNLPEQVARRGSSRSCSTAWSSAASWCWATSATRSRAAI